MELGDGLSCYAVDHSPSLLWDSATWEISRALMPYLRTLLAGPEAWEREDTLRRAIEIRDGVVQNPKILSFQGRAGLPSRSALSHQSAGDRARAPFPHGWAAPPMRAETRSQIRDPLSL